MLTKNTVSVFVFIFSFKTCLTQMILFGDCIPVETMKYFSIDRFLGKWYEIQRYPVWYEWHGRCAYKQVEACGRRIQVEHSFVKSGIQYILRVNSTYAPGDEAILNFRENNMDPLGIPMTVISTDYTDYALVYGCKYKADLDLKYLTAWILSREPSLSNSLLQKARDELSSIRYSSVAFLETVDQVEANCTFHSTAEVQVVYFNSDEEDDNNK